MAWPHPGAGHVAQAVALTVTRTRPGARGAFTRMVGFAVLDALTLLPQRQPAGSVVQLSRVRQEVDLDKRVGVAVVVSGSQVPGLQHVDDQVSEVPVVVDLELRENECVGGDGRGITKSYEIKPTTLCRCFLCMAGDAGWPGLGTPLEAADPVPEWRRAERSSAERTLKHSGPSPAADIPGASCWDTFCSSAASCLGSTPGDRCPPTETHILEGGVQLKL
ncbi:hypothetical protein EYF80_003656 [Liparis tanakae]|uniref:Uncharacterized protein n=1 Tax=Liparis tanakae TaxID=230148 RepID=A0A4Z2J7S9_9TELE|nr:hypothetical protein EYF80_003656 [Liparis tanakae]